MLRTILVIALAMLSACASIPTDPNIAALLASDERRAINEQTHAQALADQSAVAISKCAGSPDVATCMLGLVALAAVQKQGAGQGGAQPSALAHYQPPPSRMQTAVALLGAGGQFLGPLVGGYVAIEASKQNGETTRYLAGVNAARESGMFGALTGLGRDLANAPPGVYVGGNYGDTYGNDYTGGDRTQIAAGRDYTGRDHTDNTGVIGSGTVRNNSDDLREVGNCVAGNGAAGAAGGASGAGGSGGTASSSPGGIGGAGGGASPGGSGGNGGNGGACVPVAP